MWLGAGGGVEEQRARVALPLRRGTSWAINPGSEQVLKARALKAVF